MSRKARFSDARGKASRQHGKSQLMSRLANSALPMARASRLASWNAAEFFVNER